MDGITRTDLLEARTALTSVIRKCEKAQETLRARSTPSAPQLTLLARRLKALRLSVVLIERELKALGG